jgi:uracil-DNA glycosylase family 4
MSGFFTKEEIPFNNQINKATCSRCGLYLKCRHPKMEPSGGGKKEIYIVLDCPSTSDDESNLHLSGDSGQFLLSIFKKLGVDVRNDCIVDYAVKCKPPKGEVLGIHIEACRSKLWDNLTMYKPKVVIILGATGLEMFLKPRWEGTVGEISTWRGFTIPDRSVKAWVCPSYSPRFVAQNDKHPVLKKILADDIYAALDCLNKPYPNYIDEEKLIKIINNESDQVDWLSSLYNKALQQKIILAMDYETTGLKPHAPGHQIACTSMCYNENEAVSMWNPTMTPLVKRWVKKILTCGNIIKIAHNIKYEMAWTLNILGYPLHPIGFCTMQAAHIIDNRPGIVGLKLQSYVHFGLMGYETEIKPFLSSDGGGNSFNTVFEAPRTLLQLYNGVDSLTQFRLATKQLKETGYVIC